MATKPILISWLTFLQKMGVSDVTGWRWRKEGWIHTVNINGRLFVSEEEISKFKERAESGEFATEHKTPSSTSTGKETA